MQAHDFVRLLRRVRHDYGNHLQVISGYLQMGMMDRVKDYVDEVARELMEERTVFQAAEPEAALYFYEQILAARDMGIIIRYDDLDVASWEILKLRNEPAQSIARLQDKIGDTKGDTSPVLYLSFYEDSAGIDMFISDDAGEIEKIRLNRE